MRRRGERGCLEVAAGVGVEGADGERLQRGNEGERSVLRHFVQEARIILHEQLPPGAAEDDAGRELEAPLHRKGVSDSEVGGSERYEVDRKKSSNEFCLLVIQDGCGISTVQTTERKADE